MRSTNLFIATTVAMTFLLSCAKTFNGELPTGYSFLPKPIDLDSVRAFVRTLPEPQLETPAFPDTASFTFFPPIKLESIKPAILDSLKRNSQGAIVISPGQGHLYSYYRELGEVNGAYMEYYRTVAQAERMRIDNLRYLLSTYYSQAAAAETMYQKEIIRLRRESMRSGFEKSLPWIGFATGMAVAILTEWAVINVAR